MNSVERMVEYTAVEPEAPAVVEARRPLPNWPHNVRRCCAVLAVLRCSAASAVPAVPAVLFCSSQPISCQDSLGIDLLLAMRAAWISNPTTSVKSQC
jgi:hypothetical protein